MNSYNIVVCTDKNYLKYVLVLFQSLFDSLRPDYGSKDDIINFHLIVNDDVDIDEQAKLCNAFSKRNADKLANNFSFYKVDDKHFANCSEWGRAFPESKGTYYRFFIDKLLPETIDTALYIDVDMLFTDDFRLVFDTNDVSNYLVAGIVDSALVIKDYPVSRATKIPLKYSLDNYINGGFLLLNLKACREIALCEQLLKFVNEHDVIYHDQTAINYLCLSGKLEGTERFANGPLLNIAPRFNAQQCLGFIDSSKPELSHIKSGERIMTKPLSFEEYEDALKHPVIIHFNLSKPWKPSRISFSATSVYITNAFVSEGFEKWYKTVDSVQEINIGYDKNAQYDLVNETICELKKLIAKRYKSSRKIAIFGLIGLFLLQIALFVICLVLILSD